MKVVLDRILLPLTLGSKYGIVYGRHVLNLEYRGGMMVSFIVWLRHGLCRNLTEAERKRNLFAARLTKEGVIQVEKTVQAVKEIVFSKLPGQSSSSRKIQYLSSHAARALETFGIAARVFGGEPRLATLTVSSSLYCSDDKFNLDVANLLATCVADIVVVTTHMEWCEWWSERLPRTIGGIKLPIPPNPNGSAAIKVRPGAAVILDIQIGSCQLVS